MFLDVDVEGVFGHEGASADGDGTREFLGLVRMRRVGPEGGGGREVLVAVDAVGAAPGVSLCVGPQAAAAAQLLPAHVAGKPVQRSHFRFRLVRFRFCKDKTDM